MASSVDAAADGGHGDGETRRDFLLLATGAMGAVGIAAAVWPLIDQMNPAADVLAVSTTELNLAPIERGQRITITWRGSPVFVAHRTEKEIEEARKVNISELVDPQKDSDRVKPGKDEWLVVVGVCTHLGCIPLGQKPTQPHGDYGGWFCPCHGSHYDTSGRRRKGPAPKNLAVPDYVFKDDKTLIVGLEKVETAKPGAAAKPAAGAHG